MKSISRLLLSVALLHVGVTKADESKGLEELKQLHAAAWKAKKPEAFRPLYETTDADTEIFDRMIKMEIENFTTFPNQTKEIVGFVSLSEMEQKIKDGTAKTSKGSDMTPAFKATIEYATKGRQMGVKFMKPNLAVTGVVMTKGMLDGSPNAKRNDVMEGITPVGITKAGKLRFVLPRAAESK